MPSLKEEIKKAVNTDVARLYVLATKLLHEENRNPFAAHQNFLDTVKSDLGLLNSIVEKQLPQISLDYLRACANDMAGVKISSERSQSLHDAPRTLVSDDETGEEVSHNESDTQIFGANPSPTETNQEISDTHASHVGSPPIPSSDDGHDITADLVVDASSDEKRTDQATLDTQQSNVSSPPSTRVRRNAMPSTRTKELARLGTISCVTGAHRIFGQPSMQNQRIGEQLELSKKALGTSAHRINGSYKKVTEATLRYRIYSSGKDARLKIREAFDQNEFANMAEQAYKESLRLMPVVVKEIQSRMAALIESEVSLNP